MVPVLAVGVGGGGGRDDVFHCVFRPIGARLCPLDLRVAIHRLQKVMGGITIRILVLYHARRAKVNPKLQTQTIRFAF